MSDGKRVSLQSIGPAKKDKKGKTTSTSIRLSLTLPTCNSDTFADFNYNTLIINEKRKKEKNREKDDKVNGGAPTLDPYASDDDEDLRQIARSFESKYGTPKKKCRRLEDYTELGTGYDENDSFIDNTDAYDEVLPEDQTPALDGFYINKGQLTLKRVDGRSSSDHSDSDESEGPQNSRNQKRPLSSESGSSSSSSSSGSEDSDDSEDSEDDDDEENDDDEEETEDSSKEVKSTLKEIKENKSNGHVTSPESKKPKTVGVSSKKAKNKAITGLFLKKAVTEKEHNEKRLKLDQGERELSEKRPKPAAVEKEAQDQQLKADPDVGRRIYNHIDAAIEAVARGDEDVQNLKLNGQTNGIRNSAPPLPDDLPENLLKVVSAIKEKATNNSNLGKQQFFNNDVNALLLSFEKLVRALPRDKKGGVYDHLAWFLPCCRETLIKRAKALLLDNVEAGFKEPLVKLKAGVDAIMPSALERYRSMSDKYEKNFETMADPSDPSKVSPVKAKTPRRRFPWTDELKHLLCVVVKKRRMYYGMNKHKNDHWDIHLREFLKTDVVPLWPTGWMRVASLSEIIAQMNPDLFQFKVMTPGNKKTCPPPKKNVLNTKGAAEDLVSNDSPVERIPNTTQPVNSKPLQTINHQSQNNAMPMACADTNARKIENTRSGSEAQTIASVSTPQSNRSSVSQTSSLDLISNEIVECIRTSLANSLVSVTPVQNSSFLLNQSNKVDGACLDTGSKKRVVPTSSPSLIKPDSNSVDVINLQANGIDSSVEPLPKKRHLTQSNATQNSSINPSSWQSLNPDLQSLSKTLSSNSLAYISASQSSHTPSSSPHSSIKVSSVSAINLKLSASQSQPPALQTQAPSSKSQPLNHLSVSASPSISGHQVIPSYTSQSVISHGLETSSLGNNSSLTITPVKPTIGNTYYQQVKSSGHSHNSTSHGSQANSNLRSEVIVTPSGSSSMPHIKSTNVNYSVTSADSVSSSNNFSSSPSGGNNFSTSHSNSGNTYLNSRGVSSSFVSSHGNSNYSSSHGNSGPSYSNLLSNSDVSVRTNRPQVSVHESQPSKSPGVDKGNFAQPQRSQFLDKNAFVSPAWAPSAPLDVQRSSSSSPSSLKSITSSPEKVMVSRKDRILQDSRERHSNEPVMPTLSGPYQSSNALSDQSNAMRNQSQPSHSTKRSGLPEISNLDLDMTIGPSMQTASATSSRIDSKAHGKQDESRQKERAMRGFLVGRSNCDGNYVEDGWSAPVKKPPPSKSSSDISGLDGFNLGLPSYLVGSQNDYQRDFYGNSSKSAGPNEHRPS